MAIVPMIILAVAAVTLSLQGRPADERFKTWRAGLKTVKVEFTTQVDANPIIAKGSLLLSLPGRGHFDVTFGEDRYEMVTNKGQGMEVDHRTRIYRDVPVQVDALGFDSKVSGLNEFAFPWELIFSDLKMHGPGNAKITKTPGSYELEFLDEVGMVKVHFEVDSQGKLMRTVRTTTNGPRRSVRTTTFSKYEDVPKAGEKDFVLKLPDGYVPYALPDPRFGVGVGEPLNVEGWKNGKGSTLAQAINGRTTLLVLTSPQSTKGAALVKLVSGLEVPVLILSTDASTDSAQFTYKSGSAPWEYWAAGAPALFLVDKKGVLEQAWVGQGPGLDEQTLKELKQILSEIGATSK
jgi:hypothetical protein